MQKYEFILKGYIKKSRILAFAEMDFSYLLNHNTKICGWLKDQAEFHGIVNMLINQGFKILKIEIIQEERQHDSP